MTAKNWVKGMVAGFVATVVLSALILLQQRMGLAPELDLIRVISGMLGSSDPAVGWSMHFVIGTLLWGSAFAWLDPSLPGGHWLRGVEFSILPWLAMMIVMMPLAGVGFFGANLGMTAPILTLVMHLIFGAVLGGVYGLEQPEEAQEFPYLAP